MTSLFITWNPDPELINIAGFGIRWYGLLFALGFVFGYYIMKKIFQIENIPLKVLDSLTMYMIIGTVAGARLGHCFFYEAEYYLANPIEVFYLRQGGLASHGATIGNIISLIFFSIKHKKNFFWTIDRIVIVVALAGALIRTGNLVNSEIYGKPTNTESGFLFLSDTKTFIENSAPKNVVDVRFEILKSDKLVENKYIPVKIYIDYKVRGGFKDSTLVNKSIYNIYNRLNRNTIDENVNVFMAGDIKDTYNKQNNILTTEIMAAGVARYPTQIHEAVACLVVFVLLWWLYYKRGAGDKRGMLFGLFLILIFGFRFFVEFYKDVQVDFEQGMALNMGQWLSIPLVAAGIGLVGFSLWNKKEKI